MSKEVATILIILLTLSVIVIAPFPAAGMIAGGIAKNNPIETKTFVFQDDEVTITVGYGKATLLWAKDAQVYSVTSKLGDTIISRAFGDELYNIQLPIVTSDGNIGARITIRGPNDIEISPPVWNEK